MKQFKTIIGLFLLFTVVSTVSCSGPDFSNNLVDMAVSQLGITETQAMGGAGALLSVAKNNLGDSFDSIAELVPGLDSYTNIAQLVGGASESMSSLSEAGSVFENLGMEAGMVDQFVPVLTNYASSTGGTSAGELLASGLK